MVRMLLQRANPGRRWELVRHGRTACWLSRSPTPLRVHVLRQPSKSRKERGGCNLQDPDQALDTLRQDGCDFYTEENCVLVEAEGHDASQGGSVHVVRRWRPPEEGTEYSNPLDPWLGRLLLRSMDTGMLISRCNTSERTTFVGVDSILLRNLSEAKKHMEQLWLDITEDPCGPAMGVGVEYHEERVCLIQVASSRRCLMLDTLTLQAPAVCTLLQPILENLMVLKVFHGHGRDLTRLYRAFSIAVSPPVLNVASHAPRTWEETLWEDEQPSLETLCRRYLGYGFGATYQEANWSQRPIPAGMLHYAALKTEVLLPLQRAMQMTLTSQSQNCSSEWGFPMREDCWAPPHPCMTRHSWSANAAPPIEYRDIIADGDNPWSLGLCWSATEVFE